MAYLQYYQLLYIEIGLFDVLEKCNSRWKMQIKPRKFNEFFKVSAYSDVEIGDWRFLWSGDLFEQLNIQKRKKVNIQKNIT